MVGFKEIPISATRVSNRAKSKAEARRIEQFAAAKRHALVGLPDNDAPVLRKSALDPTGPIPVPTGPPVDVGFADEAAPLPVGPLAHKLPAKDILVPLTEDERTELEEVVVSPPKRRTDG
jgi:hypothetical protein